jgi:transglutaminase-like putative cysteine protease
MEMVFLPPTPPPIRGKWRIGLLAFGMAALAAAVVTVVPLLWPNWGRPDQPTNGSGDAPDAVSVRRAPTASFARRAFFAQPEVARLVATNLAPAMGHPRPFFATNALAPLRGVTGGLSAIPAASPRATKELPIFAALRASRNQPIPKEVADLAREITRNCQTDAERAKAIYDWITGHITYDWKVWADIIAGANTYTQSQDPLSVIQRGTGVCAGYAWLFDALAASVGVDANFVIGDVRGYRGTADDDLISKYLHAWNSVRIDGQWCLLDSTWGARQAGESETDYLARRDYYFETPANQLIFDHLPENANWQMLSNPIDSVEFQDLPNLKPAFFRDGLRLGNAFSAAIATTAGTPTGVTVAIPDGILVAATLSLNGQDISANNLSVGTSGIRCDVVVGPLAAGNYILRLYAKPATNAGPYECAADYVVTVTTGNGQ